MIFSEIKNKGLFDAVWTCTESYKKVYGGGHKSDIKKGSGGQPEPKGQKLKIKGLINS